MQRQWSLFNLPLLELGLETLEHGLALLGVLESLLSDDLAEVKVLLDAEASGKQVSVVHILDEGLDVRLASDLLV